MIAVIPARGGSTRIPRKNIRDFHGRPIMVYSIETAKESGLFDNIVVSTDDREIADLAIQHGTQVHWRDERLTRDDVGTQAVTHAVLNDMGYVNGYSCCIYPCAPLMRADDLKRALAFLLRNEAWQSVYVEGWFYWQRAKELFAGLPVEKGVRIGIPDEEWVDINTEGDWMKAERLYALRAPA